MMSVTAVSLIPPVCAVIGEVVYVSADTLKEDTSSGEEI